MLNLIGRRFSRLEIIAHVGVDRSKSHAWLCGCDCGEAVCATTSNLRAGHTMSCGCLRGEIAAAHCASLRTTHGHTKGSLSGKRPSPSYRTWQAMLQRCGNPNHKHYPYYGGRGISVCGRWRKFEHFYADMGDRPDGKSLDRINRDGNYEATNCRWATWHEQVQNRRPRGPNRKAMP